jgi:hypothetical protein
VLFWEILYLSVAYLGSYRLIQSLKKPALFIFWRHMMLAYGIISFISLRKEKKIDTKKIDKEIIRKIILVFSLRIFFKIINIGVLGFGWQSLFL